VNRFTLLWTIQSSMESLHYKHKSNAVRGRRIPLWRELQVLPKPMPAGSQKIVFNVQNGVEFVDPQTVTYLKANSNYTSIYSQNGRCILISKTLKFCCNRFPDFFLRIHQSYLVNPRYIQTYLKSDHTIVLDNGLRLPVSRSGSDVMREYIHATT